MKHIIFLFSATILFASCNKESSPLLIEAESFNDKGGWVVDPQFVEQMGSPYLLAHGIGTPVTDAKTEVVFNKTGNYHVWVRTMNWAHGKWKAPGRFKIAVNDNILETELGTKPGWNWQYAGNAIIKNKKT